MSTRAATLLVACLAAAPAYAAEPLSAIDWLSRSVREATPPAAAVGNVARSAAPGTVTTTPLGAVQRDAVGLVPASRAGLDPGLWGLSPVAELDRLIAKQPVDVLPASLALLYRLLLSELAPPRDAAGDDSLFLARLDKLLDLGALDQAQALIERSAPNRPEIFRRWFDVSLLTGYEDRACAAMRAAPDIAPTFPARIFCLARGGDWNAATLSLETGEALGFVTKREGALLARFLDPALAEDTPQLVPPERMTPLVFRIFEAIGQPLATTTLPLAFAQSDLRDIIGWKARLEAAERLVRSGAIPASRLIAIYNERRPAASGGVWERVRAVQHFDVAMLSGDKEKLAVSLPAAWRAMASAGLLVPFARYYGARLGQMSLLTGAAADIALRAVFLSGDFEAGARLPAAQHGKARFWAQIARGKITGDVPADPLSAAIAAAFRSTGVPARFASLVAGNRRGEAILRALLLIRAGAQSDPGDVEDALALMRSVGLEHTARQIALEMLLLPDRAPG